MRIRSALLLAIAGVALSGCMSVSRSPQEATMGNAESFRPATSPQEILPALTLEKMRNSLPPIPAVPEAQPDDAAMADPVADIAQEIAALPEPPALPEPQPRFAFDADENFIMSQSPTPAPAAEEAADELNLINSATEEALPLAPPVLPDAPAAE